MLSLNHMAFYKIYLLKYTFICVLQCIFVLSCKSNYNVSDRPKYCSNGSVSCSSQLVSFPNASESDCMIEAPGACSTWTFSSGSSTHPGSVKLVAVSQCEDSFSFTVMKLVLKDVKWTSLQFRFTEYQNKSRTFCRRFTVSSKYSIPELLYDCRWTNAQDHYKTFIFDYEAQRESHRESGKYWFKLPAYGELDLTNESDLSHWTPFLYVDVSESPTLTVRWLQAPQSFGIQKYELEVYDKDELKETKVFSSTNEEELSYVYSEPFPTHGEYKFKVHVLHESCENGTCPFSESPILLVGNSAKMALGVGIAGSLVLMCLLMAILYLWKRFKLPRNIKQPKVLIIYIQSSTSHIKAVEELAKYLRNFCFVDALLDQLDIPKTETKDPYEWYSDAFVHVDAVMVVSSPPKCCNEEGLYRDVDVIALRFLKEKFSDRNSRCSFFSVLLPYCTLQDIPNEAKHFKKFKLTKDLDKMLWFIHNGGKFPAFVDSACALLVPKLHGDESDFKMSGVNLLEAIKEAEANLLKGCSHKKLKDKEIPESKAKRLHTLIKPVQDVTTCSSEWVKNPRDVSEMNPDMINFEDCLEISLNDLDLTGAGTLDPEPLSNRRYRETQNSWELLSHPSYSPDLSPSDYPLFGHLKDYLRGHHYKTDAVQKAMQSCL